MFLTLRLGVQKFAAEFGGKQPDVINERGIPEPLELKSRKECLLGVTHERESRPAGFCVFRFESNEKWLDFKNALSGASIFGLNFSLWWLNTTSSSANVTEAFNKGFVSLFPTPCPRAYSR